MGLLEQPDLLVAELELPDLLVVEPDQLVIQVQQVLWYIH
jgi:hypothetical protein